MAENYVNDDYFGPFDSMRFPLTYEGPLPSTGNPRRNGMLPKLDQIWSIRNAISPQVHSQMKTHPAFQGDTGSSRALINAISQPIKVEGHEFYALARAAFKVKCELEIEMHVNHPIATIVTNGGDLDNRLKTLFDALRVPHGSQEFRGHAPNLDPYCCLLEDDVLVSALRVETFRNPAAPPTAGLDYVRLNIKVRIDPMAWDYVNEPFRHD